MARRRRKPPIRHGVGRTRCFPDRTTAEPGFAVCVTGTRTGFVARWMTPPDRRPDGTYNLRKGHELPIRNARTMTSAAAAARRFLREHSDAYRQRR